MATRKDINIKIKLDGKAEFKTELDKLIKESGANNLKFDTSSVIKSLGEFSKVLSDISSKMKTSFNSSQINNETSAINKATEAQRNLNKELSKSTTAKSNNPKVDSITNVFKDDGSGKERIKEITTINNELGETLKITKDLRNGTEITSDTSNYGKQDKYTKEGIALYEKDEKKKTQIVQDEFDKRIKLEQQYSDQYNKLLNNKDRSSENDNIKAEKEGLDLYNQNELKKTQTIQDETNKRIKAEQDYSDKYNKILNDKDRANEQSQIKATQELDKRKSDMQGKIGVEGGTSGIANNKLVDDPVIKSIQARLNSINTDTADNEIKQLEQEINNLGSSEPQIVRVQTQLSKMVTNLEGMKGKYKDLVGDKDSITQLKAYENEIENLRKLLASLQSGSSYNGAGISKQLDQASNSSRELTNSVKNSSSALKLSQQDAQSFSSSIKKAFANVGMYTSVYEVLQLVTQAFKQGITTVIQMDTAMADLNKVVSMSKIQLDGMKDSAIEMGIAYAKSAVEVGNAQAEAGRLYKDSATINKITEASLIGSNVMDNTTSAEVAKSMATVMTAMKMDVSGTMTILDSMNSVQNSYKISADSMIGALNEVASTAYTSGVSLQKVEGYITAIGVSTGKESSEVGNSVRSLLAKIYKPKAQDTLEQEAGISVKDEMGEYKKAGDVLDELNTKWSTLTYTQMVNVSQSVGGIQRYNDFMSLMNNYQMSLDATVTAENSRGSAMKENEIYMQSAQAKIEQLKTTLQEFALNAINSDMLKGGIDGLKGLVEIFGNFPMVVGLATTALLIFKGKAILGAIQSTIAFGSSIVALSTQYGVASVATGLFSTATNVASTSLKSMSISLTSNPLGLFAVAIASLIVLTNDLGKNIQTTESLISGLDKSLSGLKDVKSQEQLISKYEELENKIKSGNLSIQEEKKSKEDLLGIQKQLGSTFGDMITGYTKEGVALATNIDKVKEKIKANKELAKLEAEQSYNGLMGNIEGKNNYNTLGKIFSKAQVIGGSFLDSGTQKALTGVIGGATSDLEEYGKLLDKVKTKTPFSEDEQKKYGEIKVEYDAINEAVVKLKESGIDISGKKMFDWETGKLVDAKTYLDSMASSVDNANPKLEDLKEKAEDTAQAFKDMSDAFSQANDNIKLLESVRTEFGKNGVLSGETIEKMFASGNTDIIALLGNKNTLMDESNKLLGTEKTSRDQNYESIIKESMATRDKTNSVIDGANTESKATQTTTNNNAGQYGADANNKANSETSKTNSNSKANSIMFDNGKGITTALSGLYGTDVTNKINAENSKGDAVGKVNNGILSASSNMTNQLGGFYKTDSENFRKSQQDKLIAMLKPFDVKDAFAFGDNWDAYKEAEANKKFYDTLPQNIGASTYNPVNSTFTPVGIGSVDAPSGGGGGNGSGSGSSSEAVKKEVENMKDLRKRYYELDNTIADLNGRYTQLGTIKENTYGKQYVNYLNDEIESLKKQQQAVSNLADAVKTERYELMRDLEGNWGFSFGGQGEVTNYQNQLKTLQDRANAMSGDAKENQIKAIEEVSSKLEKYTDLTINKTNEMGNQWYELSNKIRDSYKAMVDAVATKEKEVSDIIKYYAEKNVKTKQDAIDRQIDAVNKMYDKEDKEVDLSKKKKELAELKSEMDKFQFATDKIGINKFKALQEQYKTLEEDMNNTIRDTQKQSTLDAMNKEKDDLGKSLEEYLKPENINKIIEASLKSGMIDLMGNVVSLNEANSQMLKETEIGYTNVASKTKEWKDYLSNIIAMYPQLANITSNLGYNIDRTAPINLGAGNIDVSNLSTGVSNSGVNVSMPVSFYGDISDNNMSEVRNLLTTGMTKVKKEIMTAFGNR